MLQRGDTGPAVVELQTELMALGYGLPRWGADGYLGSETLDAATHFCADHAEQDYNNVDRDVIGDAELASIKQCYDAIMAPLALPGRTFYDRRATAARQGCLGGRRSWGQITGITLHQTACDFGKEKPARWDTLHAHVGTSREGNVFWVYDFEQIVWHGNELNGPTVGIEMEGNYAGVAGDRSTAWQPGPGALMVPTPELVTASQDAIRWICQTVAQHGGKVVNLYAHRQTAGSRRADPGAELWQQVALPMIEELVLSDGGPDFKIDNGRVIPAEWNLMYPGAY